MVGSKGSWEETVEVILWDRFLATGSIWMAADLAPPAGREKFLGGGTFRKAIRPKERIQNPS
jgi:hypothetical protein